MSDVDRSRADVDPRSVETIRVLLHLLVHGDADECEGGGDAASLFCGGRTTWVRSVTTINTPHDGVSPFADQYDLVY